MNKVYKSIWSEKFNVMLSQSGCLFHSRSITISGSLLKYAKVPEITVSVWEMHLNLKQKNTYYSSWKTYGLS